MMRCPIRQARRWARWLLATPIALVLCHGAMAQGQWRSGEELYNKLCGHCHKPAVGVGTVLEGRVLPLEYLKVIVRNGLLAMPAFPESHVGDADLAAISDYLGSLQPVPTPPAGGKP
jgi:mono/diheme cytochrome c family protein